MLMRVTGVLVYQEDSTSSRTASARLLIYLNATVSGTSYFQPD